LAKPLNARARKESGTARVKIVPLADFAIAIKSARKKESGTARVNIDYLQCPLADFAITNLNAHPRKKANGACRI
jgi:hypothetical protein